MDYLHTYESPLGKIVVASDGENIVGLWFENGRYFAEGLQKERQEQDDLPIFREADHWLDIYFSSKEPDFLPPLLVRGSDFRQRVCQLISQIPYGQTATYGELAQKIAKERGVEKMSAQAVGGAVGHNPISLMIPCHRVVGTNGSLTGYGGGIQRKVKLLQLERVDMSHLFVPKKGTAL